MASTRSWPVSLYKEETRTHRKTSDLRAHEGQACDEGAGGGPSAPKERGLKNRLPSWPSGDTDLDLTLPTSSTGRKSISVV